ncbi:caspase family protein [Modestobacter sp. DSM 44400]|uniref:caspase family protein n=1 Tax=Modestobacter sp. DSM 44400 TaxID=1550230 RepID=UPI001115344C|nr:caspase family protein [Modestobacter sp. DSM 44400]
MTAPAGGLMARDHALVVGISHYPQLAAEGVAADLHGPDHDALAVRDWLVDGTGGRLPSDHVVLIRTADCVADDADPQPASQRVKEALEDLEKRTRGSPGRRLYLYFSGHGFAPDLEEAAVFTAEASQLSPSHVYAHAWLRWFRKAQRFEQSVLWVDACMNYQQSIPVQPVPLRTQLGTAVPGPAFISVAAQTKSALEVAMPDGEVHGVFTWTLLEGLRGGAADRRGRVTGESLQDFLHNAMAEFLPPAVKRTAAVDLQPFVRADEGMDFARFRTRPVYDVTLALPAASAGQEMRLWSGAPHRQVVGQQLTGPEWTGEVVRGLYVVDVPDAGLRQGFQVTGSGAVQVTVEQRGPAVVPCDGSELFTLEVDVPNPATTVVVVDHEFQRVLTDTGHLAETEAPGVYKVRTLFGRDLTTASELVVLLDADLVVAADGAALLTAAPLPGSAAPDAQHSALFTAAGAAPDPGTAGAGSAVSVMGRYSIELGDDAPTPVLPHPLGGLRLVDPAGHVVADLVEGPPASADREAPVAVWERAVAPGTYALRQELAHGTFEGSVVVSAGWVTQVVLRRTTGLGGGWRDGRGEAAGVVHPDDVALFMHRPGAPAAPDQDEAVEGARLALVQGRDVFSGGRGGGLRRALLEEYEDPVAGIIGGHLLLRAMAGPAGTDSGRAALFDQAVTRLRGLLGDEHPDVRALSLRCSDPALRATRPFTAPPMFSASWQLVVAGSYDRPELVPAATWARVHASTRIGPLFIWAADAATQRAHSRQLRAWVDGYVETDGSAPLPAATVRGGATSLSSPVRGAPEPVPSGVWDAARSLGIPATAAAGLWQARIASP